MAGCQPTNQTRERANSFPENIIRKVTIQQTIVKPASSRVVVAENGDNVRRYPKVEYHDPSNRGHRGKCIVRPTRSVITKDVNGVQFRKIGEREDSETSPRTGENELWQKAVRELELVIAQKDTAIENLSKVNRKLSGDVQWYEKSLEDCKENLRTLEARLEQAERDRKDQEWYERALEERECKMRELEQKLNKMTKPEDTDMRSLKLSQGAKSVLKNLELRREKSELEKKVNELEEKLKELTSETSRQKSEPTFFRDVISNLNGFQAIMVEKLNHKMQMVADFDTRLSTCILNCQNLTEQLDSAPLSSNNISRVEETITQHSSLQLSSLPESGPCDDLDTDVIKPGVLNQQLTNSGQSPVNFEDAQRSGESPGDVNQRDATPGIKVMGYTSPRNTKPDEIPENLNDLKEALIKEKKINDEIIERFLEIEDTNKVYQETIEALQVKANHVEHLRDENRELVRQISELKEKENRSQDDTMEHEDQQVQKGIDGDATMKVYEEQINSLRSVLESQKDEMKELREKAGEDDELIEELRANVQREEKWNREMQRKYEWELGCSQSKDEQIEEFQDCLWEREKTVRQLREQLEFEDKRCEELLEKLVASQKEAQEFEELVESLQRKLDDKEKRITEFCEQNDRDAVAIENLSSENQQLRIEVECLMKTRRNLEEDLEAMNDSLEMAEQNKETVITRQKENVTKLCIQLEEEELMNKSKDEVIEELQENVVSLSADVKEMEFRMEERKIKLEEEVIEAKHVIKQKENDLTEASERYKEMEKVCESLREKISQKDDQIVEREAEIAWQREKIEIVEQQMEELRRICGDTSTQLNDKPALVYTEAEMDEVNEFLEQERKISETYRTHIEFLANKVKNSKNNLVEKSNRSEAENEILKEELVTSGEESHATNIEVSKKETLASKEKELMDFEENMKVLQLKLMDLENAKQGLENTVKDNEGKLSTLKDDLEKLVKVNESLKDELRKKEEDINRKEFENIEELKTLHLKLKDFDEDKQELENTIKDKQNKLDTLMDDLEKKVQANKKLEEQLCRKEEDTSKREFEKNERLEGLHAELEDLRKQKLELENAMKDKEGKLDTMRNDLQKFVEANENLKVDADTMAENIERLGLDNDDLKEKLTNLNARCLQKEEELRVAQVSIVNLKYSLDEYVSQHREQILTIGNYDKEVETLTKYIQDMDELVRGIRGALEEAVNKESANEDESAQCKNEKVDKGLQETTLDTKGTSMTNQGKEDSTDGVENSSQQHLTIPVPAPGLHSNNDATNDDVTHSNTADPGPTVTMNKTSPSFFEKYYDTRKGLKNRSLLIILGFLVFVFLFGCVNNSIVSRKYLFVFANSIISLTMFVLWRDEVRRTNQFSSPTFRENSAVKFQENGHLNNNFQECQHCGNTITPREDKSLRFARIKSSFQELHEKFLEAVENSSKDTLPIQELYNEYEKLKDEVDAMREDRLRNDSMMATSFQEDESEKENVLAPKWNKVILNLGRVLIIVVLCEILYTRGPSLPHFVQQVTFVITSAVFSYLLDIFCVDSTREQQHAGQNAKEVAHEMDELNEIIDKEHELVMKQREAIKALEKRLRKEFERRIKQRNVLLKKLKYKGKLEDLRELLDDRDDEDTKGDNTSIIKDKYESNDQQLVATDSRRDRIKILEDILTETEQPLNLDLTFSPMFFFLGIPLTGVMLSCRYFLLAVVMTMAQMMMFLKESKYIEPEMFPGFLRKGVSPIIMDTVVVLYACLLAVCLQCSQGIVVLFTCSIVQLGVHWWTCYRLAKKENVLYQISRKCLL